MRFQEAMMRGLFVAVLFVFQAAARTPAPAVYKTAAELTAGLTTAPASPDMATAAVENSDHYRINIVRRTKPAGAVAHPEGTEVHHIIEGAGTLVTGGSMVRSTSGRGGGATIEGGRSRRVAKGDVILIPAGTPHWYKDLEGTITYLEVRFELPKP
jgi:mannose-6-phosphate isomerase-like protein (cupin superfamily)